MTDFDNSVDDGVRAPDRNFRDVLVPGGPSGNHNRRDSRDTTRLVEREEWVHVSGDGGVRGEDNDDGEEGFDPFTNNRMGSLTYGAVVGGLLGGVSAMMQRRPVVRGAIEGAALGGITNAIFNEVESGNQRRQEYMDSHGHIPLPLRTRAGASIGAGHPFEDIMRQFLTARALMGTQDAQLGVDVDRMSYEQMLETFGNGAPVRRADDNTIAQLPEKMVGTDSDSSDCCSICLGEFVKGEMCKTLPCAHQYHSGCIDQWLSNVAQCPMCKTDIR